MINRQLRISSLLGAYNSPCKLLNDTQIFVPEVYKFINTIQDKICCQEQESIYLKQAIYQVVAYNSLIKLAYTYCYMMTDYNRQELLLLTLKSYNSKSSVLTRLIKDLIINFEKQISQYEFFNRCKANIETHCNELCHFYNNVLDAIYESCKDN